MFSTIFCDRFIMSLMLQTSEPYYVLAFIDQQVTERLGSEIEKYCSSRNHINSHLDLLSESSQGYKSRSTEAPNEEVKTVTIVEYAEPSSPTRQEVPFSILSTDPCGDGSNQFTTESGVC